MEVGSDQPAPRSDTPIVANVWGINLRKGDIVHVSLKRREEVVVENSETLERNKALFLLFASKKAPAGGFQPAHTRVRSRSAGTASR
ncbi:MAG: hypothetical protein ACREDO_01455 [Methyloceanibacter sp.]